MASITVQKEYGYVIITAAAACVLSTVHGIRVTALRRPAGVPYPNPYASAESIAAATPDMKQKKYLFNCAQRAHANYLENLPTLLTGLLVGGTSHPLIATGLGAGWLVSRELYYLGYMSPDKVEGKGRMQGSTFWVFQFSLLALMGKAAFDMITS